MKVLSKTLIRESEAKAVQSGAFSWISLMYSAGKCASEIILKKYDIINKKVTVVSGRGNNGGDGFVIAEILAENGADVTVVTPLGAPNTDSAKHFYSKLFLAKKADSLPQNSDFIIDALFGIGLDRPLNTDAEELINKINHTASTRISIDIPSGAEADSGKVFNAVIDADLTVTFIALKPCFLLPPASDYCGEVTVADLSTPISEYTYLINEKPVLNKRSHNSHKGTFGTALMLCGSYGMAGAAMLAAKAALRSGLGILKVVIPESIYSPFTVAIPEAVCIPSKQNKSGGLDSSLLDIPKLLKSATAILIGCGCGNNEDTFNILKALLKNANIPIIIDADGINALTRSIDIIKNTNAPLILTPHPGEMARLCGVSVSEIEANRVKYAEEFAKRYNCVLVLKGSNTIIAAPNGDITFNTTGNTGLSTGGSGDVLAGIIASLSAQGYDTFFAAKAGVYLHGDAADKAAARLSTRSLLPSDVIKELR